MFNTFIAVKVLCFVARLKPESANKNEALIKPLHTTDKLHKATLFSHIQHRVQLTYFFPLLSQVLLWPSHWPARGPAP